MRKQTLRQTVNQYLADNRSGSARDKNHRRHVLHKLITDLYIIRKVPTTWKHFKAEQLAQVIDLWRKNKLKPSTIINYMTCIRAFLLFIGHSIEDMDNHTLGLCKKLRTNKKLSLNQEICTQLQPPIPKILMSLQVHFGLTLSESMRIHPSIHVQKSQLWLTRDITFNAQDRTVPIETIAQKQVIETLQKITRYETSLLDAEGYHSLLHTWQHELKRLKMPTRKAYRYLYAQKRERQLESKLTHYKMQLNIMDEMGLKSRTTLWRYLNE